MLISKRFGLPLHQLRGVARASYVRLLGCVPAPAPVHVLVMLLLVVLLVLLRVMAKPRGSCFALVVAPFATDTLRVCLCVIHKHATSLASLRPPLPDPRRTLA